MYQFALCEFSQLIQFYDRLLKEQNIETRQLSQGLRRRVTTTEEFWFNYDFKPMDTPHGALEAAGIPRVPRAN